uniref:Uncharacterized protein n=1 Tax=Loa loa TaxID=7209 RepID=A0A1I7VN28_LOALO
MAGSSEDFVFFNRQYKWEQDLTNNFREIKVFEAFPRAPQALTNISVTLSLKTSHPTYPIPRRSTSARARIRTVVMATMGTITERA